MLSKIVYDVKELNGGILPKVNLIGHSRGGLTNLQYALDHPDLVDSLISIGTPYFGTTTDVYKRQKEHGTLDGKKEKKKYFLMNGKIYANRFSTDCFSDYFNELAKRSKVGLKDYLEYATEKATVEELKMQNSYFINSLYKEKQ